MKMRIGIYKTQEGAGRRDKAIVRILMEQLYELYASTGIFPRVTQHAGPDCWSLTLEHRTGLF